MGQFAPDTHPPSPGYTANEALQADRFRIYRATERARRQAAEIMSQYHPQ